MCPSHLLSNSSSIFRKAGRWSLNLTASWTSSTRSFSERPFDGLYTLLVAGLLLPGPFPGLLHPVPSRTSVPPLVLDDQVGLVLYLIHGAATFSCSRAKGVQKMLVYNLNYFFTRISDFTNFLVFGHVNCRAMKFDISALSDLLQT